MLSRCMRQITSTGAKKKDVEWVFAVESEEERDEWLDSIKMVMLQELNPKTKKQNQAIERAKAQGKAQPVSSGAPVSCLGLG